MLIDAPANAPAPNRVSVTGFFTDEAFDFGTRMALGYAAQGVMDVGLVLATIARIRDHDADSWFSAWRATANMLHARASDSLKFGHLQSAAHQFLAAAEAYSQANAFADGMSDRAAFGETFGLHRQCWEAFIDRSGDLVQRIAIPYEHTSLPGYLFRPDITGRQRPTLVLTNGSEGSISGLWAYGVRMALERGFNAFLYDGPGQQTMLFDRQVPFRRDWEAVLTPVIDTLVARTDVDGSAMFAYGVSQAGYWVSRALAFEHRFVAAMLDPGVMDVSSAWISSIPSQLQTLLRSGNRDGFNAAMAEAARDSKLGEALAARGRPFAKETPYDTLQAALSYNLNDVIGKIRTPLLIADPDEEAFWPGQSQELAKKLNCYYELVHFPREDGANFHCQPMARLETHCKMFDFFEDRLAARRRANSLVPG